MVAWASEKEGDERWKSACELDRMGGVRSSPSARQACDSLTREVNFFGSDQIDRAKRGDALATSFDIYQI